MEAHFISSLSFSSSFSFDHYTTILTRQVWEKFIYLIIILCLFSIKSDNSVTPKVFFYLITAIYPRKIGKHPRNDAKSLFKWFLNQLLCTLNKTPLFNEDGPCTSEYTKCLWEHLKGMYLVVSVGGVFKYVLHFHTVKENPMMWTFKLTWRLENIFSNFKFSSSFNLS